MFSTAVTLCCLLYTAVFTSAGTDPECVKMQTYKDLQAEKELVEKNHADLQAEKELVEKNLGDEIKELHGLIVRCRARVDVTLDPDTAHPWLILSGDGKQVRRGDTRRDVPDNPERFDTGGVVLGKEGFSSGRFYYEVQVKDKTWWYLGVARESINRKGSITLNPGRGYWSIWLWEAEYTAAASPPVLLSLSQQPQKVGVFVDYEQGEVSFYDVDHRSLIYSFTGQTFTEKLYPYFNPGRNDGGKNTAPLIITPVE